MPIQDFFVLFAGIFILSRLFLFGLVFLLGVWPSGLRAQAGKCFLANKKNAEILKEARKKGGVCKIKCKGCGCKGGPGYRRPPRGNERRGGCVSYARLVKDCGPPPHARCTAECKPVIIGCKKPSQNDIQAATKEVKVRKRKSGCGSRGGSGYRGPKGRCVGKKRLRKICGNPPTLRCKAENVPPISKVQ